MKRVNQVVSSFPLSYQLYKTATVPQYVRVTSDLRSLRVRSNSIRIAPDQRYERALCAMSWDTFCLQYVNTDFLKQEIQIICEKEPINTLTHTRWDLKNAHYSNPLHENWKAENYHQTNSALGQSLIKIMVGRYFFYYKNSLIYVNAKNNSLLDDRA